MMKRVYRCIIFLSEPYIKSANCCVEIQEAIRSPDKISFVLLDPPTDQFPLMKEAMLYLAFLSASHPGIKIYNSMPQLIQALDKELTSPDAKAYLWWKSQQITISGAPERVLSRSPIPMFSLNLARSRPVNALYVGPLFLAGDCTESGTYFLPPWLLLLATFAVGFNFIDIYRTLKSPQKRLGYVYVLLGAIACICLAPFFELKKLLNTRYWMHEVFKPLLASRALKEDMKNAPKRETVSATKEEHRIDQLRVIVKGSADDRVCANLRQFLSSIGHGVDDQYAEYEKAEDGKLELKENHITVLVIGSIEARNKWLGGDDQALGLLMQNSIVVYSGDDNPFSDGTEVAQTLMRYMVLTKDACKQNLAKDIFSSIAVRVVKYLHHGHEQLV